MRPFKPLIVYEKEIKAYTQRLADKFEADQAKFEAPQAAATAESFTGHGPASSELENRADETGSAGMKDGPPKADDDRGADQLKDDDNSLETKHCLNMLMVLVRMYDRDLKATLDVHRQVDEGSLRSIAFADLWHPYRHGHEIRSGSDVSHTQIYRILNVTGGRPFLCSRDAAAMEPLDPEAYARDPVIFIVQVSIMVPMVKM